MDVRDAYVADASGRRLIDVRRHALHVLGYSTPVRQRMSLDSCARTCTRCRSVQTGFPIGRATTGRRGGSAWRSVNWRAGRKASTRS